MRGLAGIVRFDQAPLPPDHIDRMLAAMGIGRTDRVERRLSPAAAFGHLTEFVLPEDRLERQPLHSADGRFALVTTALLENRPELAAAFGWNDEESGRRSDGEFVSAAFARWGEACPARLEGMFSLAVWDHRARRLFCAVDFRGLQPLYLWSGDGRLAFASTLRGLLALPGVPRRIDEIALAEHVAGVWRASPRTLYRDIIRLNGAHTLVADATGLRTTRYWTPDPGRILRLNTEADYREAFRTEFAAAVRRSLRRAPSQVGLLLSGGLDSSAVAAFAGPLLAAEGRRLQAFHVLPRDDARYARPDRELDESRYAAALRAHTPSVDFHFLRSNSGPAPRPAWDDFFSDNLVPSRGLPAADDPGVVGPLDHLGIGTLWTGGGGNALISLEAFPSGYLVYLALTGRWPAWWRETRGHSRVHGRPFRGLARQTALNPFKRLLRGWPTRFVPSPDDGLYFLHPALRERTALVERLQGYRAEQDRPPLDFRAHLQRRYQHLAAQQVGAAPAVISRLPTRRIMGAPLTDRRLNEFCLSLPFDQHIRDGWDRRLLRESLRDLLPDEVRLRVTRGFPQPEFQRHFAQAEPLLTAEVERLGASALVRDCLDYPRLCARWQARHANPSFGGDHALVAAIVTGAFLQWHESQAG